MGEMEKKKKKPKLPYKLPYFVIYFEFQVWWQVGGKKFCSKVDVNLLQRWGTGEDK